MASPEDISKLFGYNRWANARTLRSISGLTAEEYSRPLGGSFGSLRDTLAHLYGAEWLWLERWRGRSPRSFPETPTLEALREKWRTVEEEQAAFVESVTHDRLAEVLTYVNLKGETWSYPLGETLLHLVNHSTYHRGQVATLLRQLGKVPASTDYLLQLDEGK